MSKKLKKLYSCNFLYFFDQKIAIFLSLRLFKGRPQEKPSALKREHPALQKIKFFTFFLFLWIIFALLNPDPTVQINADPCGSGSETPSKNPRIWTLAHL
jgi:hypothetical protein